VEFPLKHLTLDVSLIMIIMARSRRFGNVH
jgi:hypothetical protein